MAHSRLPGAVDSRLSPAYLGWTPLTASLTLRGLWQASLETTYDDGDAVVAALDFSGNGYHMAVQGSGADITWQAGGGKPHFLSPSSGTRWLWDNTAYRIGTSAFTLIQCATMTTDGTPPVFNIGLEDCNRNFGPVRNEVSIWCVGFNHDDLTTTYPVSFYTYQGGTNGVAACYEDVDGVLTSRGTTTLSLNLDAEVHLFDFSRYSGTPKRNARFYGAAVFSGVMGTTEMEEAMLYFERLRP